jgi:hypothetical protein
MEQRIQLATLLDGGRVGDLTRRGPDRATLLGYVSQTQEQECLHVPTGSPVPVQS